MSVKPAPAVIRRSFFDRPVLEVAPDLLGRVLVRTTPQGPVELRLTEVEAYAGPLDPGSHAYRGRTRRNEVMFGPPGHAYVYFTYGMWHCLNLVCGPEGTASGVLLRAGEVVRGADLARIHRPNARNDIELARGPARLATALDIDRALNGADVCPPNGFAGSGAVGPGDGATAPAGSRPDGGAPATANGNGRTGPLHLLHGTPPDPATVRSGPRTGVGGDGAETPWRFWIDQDPTVSPYRPHVPRRRNGPGRE